MHLFHLFCLGTWNRNTQTTNLSLDKLLLDFSPQYCIAGSWRKNSLFNCSVPHRSSHPNICSRSCYRTSGSPNSYVCVNERFKYVRRISTSGGIILNSRYSVQYIKYYTVTGVLSPNNQYNIYWLRTAAYLVFSFSPRFFPKLNLLPSSCKSFHIKSTGMTVSQMDEEQASLSNNKSSENPSTINAPVFRMLISR